MSDAEYQYISFVPVRDVSCWDCAEEWPTGTRKKVTVIEPDTGKHHIFKFPKERREHQIWSEMLGSFVAGDLLGWDVQRVGIAVMQGHLGNLLGYIYEPGSLESNREIFIEGYWFCKESDPKYDRGKGTRHTLPLLLRVCDEVLVTQYNLDRNQYLDFWARAFALDCLISNTDRHAENWAVIVDLEGRARMAPLYDNGTSLGCNIDQVGLGRAFGGSGDLLDTHLEKQRRNGRHHVRAVEQCKRGSLFEEVCGEFLKCYPAGRRKFEEAEALNIEDVGKLMDMIMGQNCFCSPYRLTQYRQKHIFAMLRIGKERIRNVLSRR